MDSLALRVHKRKTLIKRLWRSQPLKGRARRAGFKRNQKTILAGERYRERLSLDGVWGGEREGDWGVCCGVGDGGDGEIAGV